MQAASEDPEDGRVVWTCCKNNDGDHGPRSAWERANGLFAAVQEFDNPNKDDRVTITETHMETVFERGVKKLTRPDARDARRHTRRSTRKDVSPRTSASRKASSHGNEAGRPFIVPGQSVDSPWTDGGHLASVRSFPR